MIQQEELKENQKKKRVNPAKTKIIQLINWNT